jgi:hypothetical protein
MREMGKGAASRDRQLPLSVACVKLSFGPFGAPNENGHEPFRISVSAFDQRTVRV